MVFTFRASFSSSLSGKGQRVMGLKNPALMPRFLARELPSGLTGHASVGKNNHFGIVGVYCFVFDDVVAEAVDFSMRRFIFFSISSALFVGNPQSLWSGR